MKRKDLKEIYDRLSNQEKWDWGKNSKYDSYEGVYRYLTRDPNAEPSDKVMNGLISTIGQEKLNQYIRGIGIETEDTQEVEAKNVEETVNFHNFAKKIVETVFNSNNVEQIESIKKNFESVVSACDNQLERIKINSEI